MNPDVVRQFCTNYAELQSFLLSVDLLRGAKVAERKHTIIDIATAARMHHERFRHACL